MKTHLLSFACSAIAIPDEIIQCFSPVRIYLPWGADLPDYTDNSKIIVSYPPEGLMPGVDIKNLLNEYYSLALMLGEKSRHEIIKRGASPLLSDESIKDIRAALMGGSFTGAHEKDQIIRWHLLLHLADRFEKERNEAERMIAALRKRESPLLNNAELDDNNIYPLETLAGMDTEPSINEKNFRQLLRAWQALFGEYAVEGGLFLIMNRYILTSLYDEYKELCADMGFQLPKVIKCKIPLTQTQKGRSDNINEIRAIFSSLGSGNNPMALNDLLSGYEARHGLIKGIPYIHYCLLHMKPDLVKNNTLLNIFSGRIIVLAELIKPAI
jgi:hypothetical protein